VDGREFPVKRRFPRFVEKYESIVPEFAGVKRQCEKKTAKYQRICIIGNSDVGNSTLTLELGALFQLPVLRIDRLYWQSCRVKTPKDVYLPELRKVIAEEKRIIDGNNKGTPANRLERRDCVIYMDYYLFFCCRRVIRRALLYSPF